jgi:type II secretory pathway component PulM
MMASRRPARVPVPAAFTRAWDRSSPREHKLVVAATVMIALAVAWAWIWQPIQDDTERTRKDLTRDRAVLAVARAQVAEMAGLQRVAPTPTTGDPRLPIERVLGERALKANLASLEVKDNRTYITFTAIGFDALVGVLDTLAKTDGLRPVEATLAARVDPGTVRAEIALGR